MQGRVVGIDLGTSNSVISTVIDGRAVVIPDALGRGIHPSVVSFMPNGQILVGAEAKERMRVDPRHTVYSAKRLVGRTFKSREIQVARQNYGYRIVEGDDGNPKIVMGGREFAIEEIQAMVLRHLRKIAEDYLGEPVIEAVITVPANFNESQRLATKNAGEIAGLDVLRILNEPTAAALAYGYDQAKRERIAIYDLGGGTFDITVLELRDNVFEVLSTAGNTFLGGDDFDSGIVHLMVEYFKKEHDADFSKDTDARQRFKAAAEQLKVQLTEIGSATTTLHEALPGMATTSAFPFTLTRDQFDQVSAETVQKTFLVCDEALKLSGASSAEIDRLVMVGGSTRVPLVRSMVKHYFFKEPLTSINPDEVVAVGAAIYAHNISGAVHDDVEELDPDMLQPAGPLLIDVTPHALGIETAGGFMDTIVERNSTVPARFSRTFTTSKDNQTTVRLQIYEGESRRSKENRKLGELTLVDLPAAARGDIRIEVTFEINADGMLGVMARNKATGEIQQTVLNVAGGMEEADKAQAMVDSEALDDEIVLDDDSGVIPIDQLL